MNIEQYQLLMRRISFTSCDTCIARDIRVGSGVAGSRTRLQPLGVAVQKAVRWVVVEKAAVNKVEYGTWRNEDWKIHALFSNWHWHSALQLPQERLLRNQPSSPSYPSNHLTPLPRNGQAKQPVLMIIERHPQHPLSYRPPATSSRQPASDPSVIPLSALRPISWHNTLERAEVGTVGS